MCAPVAGARTTGFLILVASMTSYDALSSVPAGELERVLLGRLCEVRGSSNENVSETRLIANGRGVSCQNVARLAATILLPGSQVKNFRV